MPAGHPGQSSIRRRCNDDAVMDHVGTSFAATLEPGSFAGDNSDGRLQHGPSFGSTDVSDPRRGTPIAEDIAFPVAKHWAKRLTRYDGSWLFVGIVLLFFSL